MIGLDGRKRKGQEMYVGLLEIGGGKRKLFCLLSGHGQVKSQVLDGTTCLPQAPAQAGLKDKTA